MAKLVAAVEAVRTVEGRLTGGFQYSPLTAAVRSSGTENLRLLAAAGELQHALHQDPSADNLHSFGVAQLLLGQPDDAVKLLEEAAGDHPEDAQVQSDLAAAYIARARSAGRGEDWPNAITAAERSTRLDPNLMEAWFNRAIGLDGFHLTLAAQSAYRDYIARDGESPWGGEARRRLSEISGPRRSQQPTPISSEYVTELALAGCRSLDAVDTQQAREWLEDLLLPAWVEAPHEETILRNAETLAHCLEQSTGDELSSEAVRAAKSKRETSEWLSLVAGLRYWQKGRQLYARNEMSAMTHEFSEAARAFRESGNPLEFWASHYVVVGYYYAGRIDAASALAEQIVEAIKGRKYVALDARMEWDRATLSYQRARFEEAIAGYERARVVFEQIGERQNAIEMYRLLAEAMARLGNRHDSWRLEGAAISQVDFIREPRRRYTLMAGAGHSALNLNMPEVAWHLFSSAVSAAAEWQNAAPLAEAHLNRARAALRLGDTHNASSDIEVAQRILAQVSDAGLKARFGADLLLANAEAALESRPSAVISITNEALKQYQSIGSEYRLAAIQLLRGRARAALFDWEAASVEFERGIALLESKRALLQQKSQRISYLDTVWDLYNERAAAEAIGLGRSREALRWVEQGRARVLLESLPNELSRPVSDPAKLIDTLPRGHALFYVAVLPNQLLTWLVSSEGVSFQQRSISEKQVLRLANRFKRVVAARDARNTDRLGAELFSLLFGELHLSPLHIKRLHFVVDGRLQLLPFGLLRMADDRRLLDVVAVSVAPSASVLASLASRKSFVPESTLVITSSKRHPAFPSLPDLPAAELESRQIASLYDSAALLAGDDATQQAFLRGLQRYNVVHFAGHAIPDPSFPWQARLVFSDADGIAAPAISEFIGRRVVSRLVVLAACSTAAGQVVRGEGVVGLARPFLAAGVTSVVATLLDVEDRVTADLMVRFHQQYRQSGDSAEALQQASLETLHRDNTAVNTVSRFIVIGW